MGLAGSHLIFLPGCCFYLVLCDDFNEKYFSGIIAHLGDHRDVHALIGQGLHHILL